MDAKQFREAVASMRSLQKEYFKNRDHLILRRAKSAEKAVDEYIKGLEKEQNGQQKLF
jgi:vacuolar-type H+-ATPase subunit H